MESAIWADSRYIGVLKRSSVTVHNDHHPGTNFARYHTYAFGPPSQNVLLLSPSIRAQIESSLDEGLAARGLRRSARPVFMWHTT
jgi:hypothetical protein